MIISVLFKAPNENRDIRKTSSIYYDFKNGFEFQPKCFLLWGIQRHNLRVWQVKNFTQHLRDVTNIHHVPISSSHSAPCLRRLKGAQHVRWVSESNGSAPHSEQTHAGTWPWGQDWFALLLALLQGFPDWLQSLSNINLFLLSSYLNYEVFSTIWWCRFKHTHHHHQCPDGQHPRERTRHGTAGAEATSKKRKHHSYFLCSWASVSFRILFPQIQNIVRVTFH